MGVALLLAAGAARGTDFHIATAQDLQNALTLAAANGADDLLYLTNGYYVGNFNFNSAEARNLTLLPEPGLTNTDITLDGAGGGRALNLISSGTVNTITVQGITFLRNCGSIGIGALRVGAGTAATINVNGCRFLSPTNTSGMGLEIVSGLNVAITNCTATGTIGGGGIGVSVSGVTGNVSVQNCVIATNISVGLSANGNIATIAGNTFSGNYSGASCAATTINAVGNIFTGNSAFSPYGYYTDGGGLNCSGTTVLISKNSFTGNSATPHYFFGYSGNGLGGGVYCNASSLVILSNNTFVANSAYFGGGTYFANAATLIGNSFSANSSTGSGGGAYFGSAATVTGNTFLGNSCGGYPGGGGVFCNGSSTIVGNNFTGNTADGLSGGGACCSGGTIYIASSNTFRQNIAGTGAGLYITGTIVTQQDNLVMKNSASSQGGGVWVNASSNLYFINNTITGNTSAGGGGGVAFQVSGVVELLNVYNNIIWGNIANGSGADVNVTGIGQKKVFNFNDVDSMSGVWDIAVSNLDVSPQFFDPVNGDYHIQSTSPCKDAGTNGAPSLPATDLDGGPRIANGTVDLAATNSPPPPRIRRTRTATSPSPPPSSTPTPPRGSPASRGATRPW